MKVYLGDGVYVDDSDGFGLWLTTEDGISTTNKVYLEPEIYRRLVEFVERDRRPAPQEPPIDPVRVVFKDPEWPVDPAHYDERGMTP